MCGVRIQGVVSHGGWGALHAVDAGGQRSRFLLRCHVVARPIWVRAAAVGGGLSRVWVAAVLRTDNGPPFGRRRRGVCRAWPCGGSSWGSAGTRLARPPEENGRHERLHATLAQETTRPPCATGRLSSGALIPSGRSSTTSALTRRWGSNRRRAVLPLAPSVPRPAAELEYPAHAGAAARGAIKWAARVRQSSAGGEVMPHEVDDAGGALAVTWVAVPRRRGALGALTISPQTLPISRSKGTYQPLTG